MITMYPSIWFLDSFYHQSFLLVFDMKFLSALALATAVCPSVHADAGPFPIINTNAMHPVNCHTGPGTMFPTKRTYKLDEEVTLTCQIAAENVYRNNFWGKTTDDCYVPDYYIRTDVSDFMYTTDKCRDVPENPDYGAGQMINDYPYRGRCQGGDPWVFKRCQCTSFVAWRIVERFQIDFHRDFDGQNWRNADMWANAARYAGYRVDREPKPGSVAEINRHDFKVDHSAGSLREKNMDVFEHGRVAWVTAVNDTLVTVEEYNWAERRSYGWRTMDKSYWRSYIHFGEGRNSTDSD